MNYLSQAEIDALIQGIPLDAPPPPVELQPFNFRRPPRVPRDRQLVLETVYGHYALAVQSFLSNRLRQMTDVALAGVELVSFSEFSMSLGSPCASYLFSLGLGNGVQGILDLDARLAAHMVDRLFGGPGSDSESVHVPTGLEQQVLHSLAERILTLCHASWADHLTLATEIVSFETSSENIRIVGPEDNLLVATFSVSSGIGVGQIALGLPMPPLESFLQDRQASASASRGRNEDRVSSRRVVEHHLRSVQIPVAARLPEFRLTAMDVASFAVGQILETGHSPQSVVELQINGRCLFHGTLGRQQGAVGLRVSAKADRNNPSRPQRRKVIS